MFFALVFLEYYVFRGMSGFKKTRRPSNSDSVPKMNKNEIQLSQAE